LNFDNIIQEVKENAKFDFKVNKESWLEYLVFLYLVCEKKLFILFYDWSITISTNPERYIWKWWVLAFELGKNQIVFNSEEGLLNSLKSISKIQSNNLLDSILRDIEESQNKVWKDIKMTFLLHSNNNIFVWMTVSFYTDHIARHNEFED